MRIMNGIETRFASLAGIGGTLRRLDHGCGRQRLGRPNRDGAL
jgi:hypothetical protein